MTWAKVFACLAALGLLAGFVFTQEPAQDKKQAKGDAAATSDDVKPATHKVVKKPFKIELTLKGMLDAEVTAEISYRPQPMLNQAPSQGNQSIRKIVEHGAKVKKGDTLITFDTTKIDEVMEDIEKEKKSLAASIRVAEEELALSEKSGPFDLSSAETAKKRADEELKHYLDVGRPQLEKEVKQMLKSAKFYVEYAEEELRQLQKMYKSNDLTEETEKIVLRRQEHSVDNARFWYQSALLEADYILKFTLPNREKTLKESQVRQEIQLERAKNTLGPSLAQKQLSLAKMRFDLEKNTGRLEKIAKDRQAMTIVSPIDGIVYYGKIRDGHWNAPEPGESKLFVNGSVQSDEVVMTVVKARPVILHAVVEEKDVHLVKLGLQGKATMSFDPQRKLPAKVAKLTAVPTAPGKFGADVSLDIASGDADLMPGMACTVKFVCYSKKDAIAVPSTAVHDEDDKTIVYVHAKGGKQETREVKVGRTDGQNTEILSGLREGEEILVERPSSKSGDKDQSSPLEIGKGAIR